MTTTITSDAAAHVLWHENRGGYQPGGFITKLLAAWAYADDSNRARLAAGWPEYAAAFALLAQPDGVAQLTRIASGGTT